MKTILLFTFFIVSSSSFGQIPSYFENDQEWSLSYSFYSPGLTDCIQNSLYADYVNGDTLINGITYKKMGRRESTSYTPMTSNPCPSDNWSDTPCYRILRQSNDSIIEYNPQSNSEILIISYNLNVGDSFTITNFVSNGYGIQQITTTSINGQNHRVFHVDTVNNHYVIEGIGHYSPESSSFIDFWGFGAGLDHTNSLDCYAQNNTTYWTNPNSSGSCNYLHDLGSNKLNSSIDIVIYPNPSQEKIYILTDRPIVQAKILSSDGKIILTENNEKQIEFIDINSIPVGNYLMILMDKSGNQFVKRIERE